MNHDALLRAAQFAFSHEDWLLLMGDSFARETVPHLDSVESVEDFVFKAYERLRTLQERRTENKERISLVSNLNTLH